MLLSNFITGINNLPINNHGENVKRRNWDKPIYTNRIPGYAISLNLIFNNQPQTNITRGHLLIPQPINLTYLMQVLMWGYPTGMGRNPSFPISILNYTAGIAAVLNGFGTNLSSQDINFLSLIRGMGVATLSKILYFTNSRINNRACIILDGQIRKVVNSNFFTDFHSLHLPTDLTFRHYEQYLVDVDDYCVNNGINSSANLELFLYIFSKFV